MNMTPENKAHFESEKEAIHLIFTGIGDEIYSTVDACKTTQEMWEAIERLQQGESLNIQDVKTNLFWEFGQFTSHDGETIESYYTNSTRIDNEMIRKQFDSCYMQYKNDNQTGQFGNQRAVNVVEARETVGGQVVQQFGIQCFNCKEFGHYGVQLQAEQSDWLADTDEEIDEQELEAHYSYMAKIQEVPNADSGTDAEPLEQDDQNDVECDNEHVLLANLIANLKLDVNENKKIQKQLKKANATLTQELTECKSILAETSRTLGESNIIRDSCLVALQNKQTELEEYIAFNNRTVDYEKLEHKLNETLGLLAQKEIDIKEEKASNVFRKEREQYFEIQDLKAQLQDKNIAISELKKLIEKCKGKSVDTKFDKPSVVRQPNAQRIPKPSVLGKPAPFSDSLERKYFANKKSVSKTNESEGLSKPVTPQNLPQTATQAVRNTNVIKPGMYQIASSTTQTRAPQLTQTSRNTNPRVSTSTGVAHRTNVSRPQPRSNQMKDKVLPNTSQVKFKKTEVEDHPRISRISKQTKSVTTCNDSLNSRTSNVNVVCATCGKLPISTRKPKSQANKSVATPHKKIVASEFTTTNPKSYYRMLYKKTSKAWKWWIAQQCPSTYTWVPKTKRKGVPKVRNEIVNKKVSFAIDNIVQLILFIVESGCTKHMTGNLSLLCNFVEKYLGTIRFGNDQFAPILGYGDLKTTSSTSNLSPWLKPSPTQAWLWHRRLSHLNFDYINLLSKKDVVIGLPKLKYVKDQLCSFCEVSKAKRSSFKSKTIPSSKGRLNLLHMDVCGPMRVTSINRKRYILVIVDDYSRYTWTLFLCSKDETPEVLKDFLMMIQRNLQAPVIYVRTDKGTEFLNKTLNAFFKEEAIEHQTSTPRTPE
ncbi:retrovirus-related pol polyprotein from transposon TNT 1-94 [Tanacetum coccineum]|uniref:Retrovirus-related pol polyprotein from transposon TNT 1-94 n=1 Tax=Tanacetum coccineum TaxID=301880 RepID=A0ABQ5GE57_9ASTR